jgi:hypothetical protein
MKRLLVLVLVSGIVFIASGCSVQQAFVLPMGVRSSTQQVLIADATREAFKSLDLTEFQGKKVYLEVNVLSQRDGDESPEETYITSHLKNELLKVGAVTVQEEAGANISLIIDATAGADFYRREIPIIVVSYLTKGCVTYKAMLYNVTDKKIISTKEGKAEGEYKETYVLGIIGPFH